MNTFIFRRSSAVRAIGCLPIFLFLLFGQSYAQPTVGGFSTPLGYIERSAPLAVAGGITLASGNDYSDGYIEFVVAGGTSADVLGYITASTPSISLNVVTIVGTTVYRGNGSIAKIIGAVDQTFNGRNGQRLRINFSAALENAQFNEPVSNGILPGWTITNGLITDQSLFPRTQGRALTISGSGPFTVTRRINQTTPGSTAGTIEYQFQTDFNYNPNSRSWWGREGEFRGVNSSSFSTSVVNDPSRPNNQVLRLFSNGSVTSPNTLAYGSMFGPMVLSSNFQAFAGDQLTLEWSAVRQGDDYEVYGYIEEVNTNTRTLLFYGRGANQPWTTVSGTIPSTGTYRFRFINGTYDQTGAFVVGSNLYIDNIRIVSAETTNDAIAQAVAQLVTYEHTSCTPPASRTLTVNARTAAGLIGTASNTINITEVNCAPTFTASVLANRTHGFGGSPTALFSSSNANTQEANQTLVEWQFTYSGALDGANEALHYDGTDITLVNGSGTTAGNAINYTVSNGTITFSATGGITAATFNSLLNGLTYKSLGVLTAGARTVSISYLKDNGGTTGGGVDSASFAANIATSTINVVVLTASQSTLPQLLRCTPASSTLDSFSVSGAGLQGNVTATAPAGFEVSLSSGTGFASSVTIPASGTLSPRTVYVRLTSAATGTPAGNVTIASSGAISQTVAISGRITGASNLSINNSLCGNQSLLWATWNNVNATGGIGTFGNLGVTVTVSHSRGGLSTTPLMFEHMRFPSQYTVPNTVSLRNDLSGVFTFTFSQPITNPQVAFSSIGNPQTPVGINTSVPYAVVWNGQSVVYNTPTRFTGNEGFTIVSFPGTHQTITLEYLADEIYANLAFGFENFNCTAPQICPGDAVTLTASGGSAYAWSPTTGLNITNAAQVIATPTVTTTYTVTDPNNPCATPRNITINVSQIPTAPTASANQLICPGARVSDLTATIGAGQSLRWYANASGGNALPSTTTLIVGNTYYAEAVDLTCGPSPSRTAVTVANFPDLIETSVGTPTLVRGTPIVIDSLVVINEVNPINGALVLISSGFASGDLLAFTGTLPAGVGQSYNANTGVLTFTGTMTPADLQAVLRQVTINTTSSNGQQRTVSFNLGAALPFSNNGHFYEFVQAPGISWTAARTAAQGRSLYGRQGYLVTVTSAAENQFVASKLAGQGWLGATDAAVEGVWRWDTGPEAGQQFWQGLGSNSGGSSVNGLYNNWATGEPNNAGNEDYAHFLSNGQWNDYPLQLSNISGYVVEYGGLPNDPCVVLVSSKSVNVVISVPPSISGAETICWNSRPVGFTGTAATGSIGVWTYQWQQREFINGVWGPWTNIAQATNFASYRPDFMFTTTEFRLLARDTGAPSSAAPASSNVITVTVRDPFTPSVISVNNGAYAFCENDQLTLTATPTLGGSGPPYQYQWQQSSDSLNWVNVGPAQNNQINLVVSNLSADTYYRLIAFDLGTPGCGSVFSINGFKVFVQPTVVAGGISGSQHICAQTAPAAIASMNAGSGRGALSYRWEASQNGGTTWSTIVGATAASYQPGVLTTTTDFRRYTISTFQGVACESPLAADSVIRILVDSLPIAQVFGQMRDTACVNAPYQLLGGYSSNGVRSWSHNGAGSLSSTTALQPIYTSVASEAGQVVRFTMVVTGSQICGLATDTAVFELLIDSLPYAIAGMADTICSNGTYQVVGASASYGTVQWSHNGAGTLQQANTLTPTYVAAAGDEGNQVRLVLAVTSNNSCTGSVDRDTIFVSVDPLPQAVAGGSDIICSGASSQISGASAQHGTILWTIDGGSGSGSILNATTLTPTYVADTTDAGSTVRLKMTVTSTNVCNPQTAVAYFDVIVRGDFSAANLINQNQELCYNTTSRVMTAQPASGGSGPYGYQWQISADSTTWTNIAGATSLTYTQPGVMSSTRYYRILSTDLGNPVCGTIVSSGAVAKITVYDPLTPPLFASNQMTICYGTSAVILPAPARGGRNDFLYQWQQSANGTSGWVNVGPPSANLAFNTPSMTSGTFYRVIARDQDFPNGDPSCGSTFSNAVRIIVANAVTVGSIAGTQTICLGSNAAILQSTASGTGSGTISYAWEGNAGQGWVRIAGATAATYDPGALTVTTQFRRFTVATLNGSACESLSSNVVSVTVDDPALFDGSSQGDTTLMALVNTCNASIFNYQVTASAPSAISYSYSMSGATVDTGAGTGSGRIFNTGVTTVRVYGRTNCAVSVYAFDVTVMDTVRPTVIAQNLTVNLDANGQAAITPAMVDNGSSDNCGIASRTLSATSFTCANVGANQVTFTVTDVNGNVQTATVVVTVVDAILPTVVAQNLTIQLAGNGQASITAAQVDNGSADNCGIANLSLSQTNFDCSHVGANNVTFTVTDVNGNVNQATAVITVRDTLKPLVLARNLRVALNASGQASITAAMVDSGSTDNCSIATRSLDVSSFSCANVGANNVTLTVTDVNGNAQTATIVVTVIDTLKPTVIAQNLTVNLDANGQAAITPAMVDNGSSDNCGIASRTLSATSFTCANVGANQVTFTVTDVNGNVQTATVVVTVVDVDTPLLAVQNRTVYLDANGVGQLTASQVDAGTTDNCGIASVSLAQTQFGCSDLGSNSILFTATDVHGNQSRSVVQVTVLDTVAPVVTRFAADTLYVTRDACAALYYWRDSISVYDACGSFTVQSTWPNVILLNKGQHQLNFSVSDPSGNAQSYSRPVVVLDTIRPTILNVPASVTIYAGANCGRTHTWVQPTPSDNCTGITMTSNFNSGDFFPLGTTQVQYFVTDAEGLTNQASFTITVIDTTAPSILVQNLVVALDANGQSNITVGMVNAGTSDNCGIATLSLSRTNFNCSAVGANNVIFTATDVHGNVSQATVVVTVVDNFPPVARTRNITAYLGTNGLANVTAAMIDSGSSDNCGIASMTISKTTFNCSNRGLNNVTFVLVDLYGNTVIRTVTVNVVDTLAPVIQLAADTITAYLGNNQCLASVSLSGIQASDNCGAPTVVTSPASGAAFSVGITPVSITATDGSGNQTQRMLYVRVLDTIAPVIVGMPTNVSLAYDSLQCGAVVSWVQPIVIDNCAAVLSSNVASGTFFGVGSHTITYTAVDPSGNSTQRSLQFTVNDVFAPRWTAVPASISLFASSSSCNAVASWTTPTATDNCSAVTITSSHASGSTFPVGLTTVVLTATDAVGNASSRSFTVSVSDTIAPTVVSMPGNAVLGICQATFNYPAPTASDACGTVTITQISGLASGSVFPLGTTTNAFRFTDASGNNVTASFTVTVQSSSLPFVPVNLSFCSNDSIEDLSRGFAGYQFFGNGISNAKLFNPAQAVIGNQAIDFTYTDSIGCSTNGRIIISVSPSPLKPVIERVNATTLRARDVYDTYQWYRYDQPIFGATQQSFVVSVSGVYTLKVGNNFGCEVFSDPFGFGVGINVEELGKDGFNVYPNPNKGRFFVHHAFDDLQTRSIVVLDMLGKVVYQQESNTAVTELDLAHLAQGRYFVRIESEKELGIKSVIIRY